MKPDETIPLLTWRARPDMSCEQVSRAWLEYTGYTPEQALGEGWTHALHPEDLLRWLDTCVRAFDERQPFEIEYRLRRRDGEYRWMLERGAPLYADGVFVGYAGALVDIDAYRRMQHGLGRALERERRTRIATEEASRLRHDLMVSVLEALRVPAEAIAACAARMEDKTMERHARAQCRAITNLLELARPDDAPAAHESLLSGVRVLVAGVDGEGRELQDMLAVAGAEVRLAGSAEDALGEVDSWQPDVLLSALGNGGDSLIRELRSLPAERGGCLRAAALGTDGAGGYDARLAKPVEPVALLATVARLAGP